jgi:uncharacterized HAD superfamily protein
MIVGLDIDGVIRPWHTSVYRHFQIFKGFEGTEREFWDYFRGLDKDMQDYYVSIPLMYMDTAPSKDTIYYVNKIAEIAQIYYITSCPEDIKRLTSKFFNIYGLPFKENIIFSKDKANYVRLNKIEYFLDDLPKNIDQLKGITNAYLFKASHNWEVRDNYNVMNSMKEFYELLLSKTRQEKIIQELGYGK